MPRTLLDAGDTTVNKTGKAWPLRGLHSRVCDENVGEGGEVEGRQKKKKKKAKFIVRQRTYQG